MWRIFFLFILLIFSREAALAQDVSQTLRGKVLDKASKFPLAGASVILYRDTIMVNGTATDSAGKFRLDNIALGRYQLRIRFIGYREHSIPNVVLHSGKEVIMEIFLEESVITGAEVTVIAKKRKDLPLNKMASVSARTFTIEETSRYAGSRDDPARMAANFAGIRGADDSRNDIIIRGNSPTGVLWRVEGIDVPNPNHFALFGTTGGPVSILNNKNLANSDFMTGAFPAEYGNAIAGVFDLNLRNGNNEKHEFTGQFGFLGVELSAEGPISGSRGSSYLITYRYATLTLMQLMGINFGVAAIPKYQDVNFKLNFPTKKGGAISIFGIGGASDIALLDSNRDTADWSFGDSGKDVFFGSRMGALGISHLHLINRSSYVKTSLATTYDHMYSQHDSFTRVSDIPQNVYRSNFSQQKISLSSAWYKKFSTKVHGKAGFIADQLIFDIIDSTYSGSLNLLAPTTGFVGNSYLLQPYFQLKFQFTNDLILNTGLHYQHFALNNSRSLEPRVGLKWNFTGSQAISAGVGLHSQLQPIYVYFQQIGDSSGVFHHHNMDLDLTKSLHYVIGYDNRLTDHLRVKVEAYYQHIYDLPVDTMPSSYSMINQGADFNFTFPGKLQNAGTGENYGIEVTVEKFYDKQYYLLLTGALFESKYTGSDGIERNTDYNARHTLNILGGKEFNLGSRKQTILTLGGKITTAGGRWYSPIDTALSRQAQKAVFIDPLAYTRQFDDYFRADIKLSIRRNSKKISQEWALDLINVFNTQNVLTQSFDVKNNVLRDEYQLGFFPVFKYVIDF